MDVDCYIVDIASNWPKKFVPEKVSHSNRTFFNEDKHIIEEHISNGFSKTCSTFFSETSGLGMTYCTGLIETHFVAIVP
ncbi:hypothetical protein HW555_007824 [Spodoptera exigua]|uniref:Uncharacterized protein n=1 Tax=Spodoptera exigua TaxID=7107 RepID=A0A835L514_SPOEX|nr:hypothetical protein HW555_007824 [Spodoptera exigua]